MENIQQKQALWVWRGLPHMLIWLALLLQIMLTGYNQLFNHIGLALPIMVALIWCWEWRDNDIALSLIGAGIFLDLLSGAPLGMHGVLWAVIYLLMPKFVYQFNEDEPFAIKWLTCGGALGLLIILESLVSAMFGLYALSIPQMIFRLLIMLMLLPSISWLAIKCKQSLYKKLWMLLPEEMRISFRT